MSNLEETITGTQLLENFKKDGIACDSKDFKEFLRNIIGLKISDDLESTKIKKLDWLAGCHPFYFELSKNNNKILDQITKITPEEAKFLQDVTPLFHKVFKLASEKKVIILVDAEQTYLQPAIDSFAVQLGTIYNKDFPCVYNTFQHYLKTSTDRIKFELERCKIHKTPFAAKFVRGAYMIEERRLAKANNYEDPIQNTIQDTHKAYNSNMMYTLERLPSDSRLMVASHNEDSIFIAKKYMYQNNLKGQVSFGQLLGFADNITFSLARDSIPVTKYTPFGPLDTLIPYLIRRAQESKQMLSSATLQRNLVLDEMRRRLMGG